MISYIDIAFIVIAVIMIIVNASRGLVVSLLSMVRMVLVVPLSYFAAKYVEPYVPADLISQIPRALQPAVLFVICFILLLILSGIILLVLKKLQKKKGVPLRHTNAFLGGVFGFVKALVIVFALSAVLGSVLEYIPQTNQFYEPVSSSYAVEYVNKINLF